MKGTTTYENEMKFSSLEEATGKIPYGLTNDYMFRAVLQKNQKVLRGLIGSLLHLDYEEIKSVTIKDPIIIGEAITDKEFRLDINVELNSNKIINLEMQLVNLGNWENRSLSYLCRSFDQLNHGQPYNEVKTAIHIGLLDFTLFEDSPEFYAHYQMMNTKNHRIYSNNFLLNVLDLNHTELATVEDKRYGIDHWAKLFKSTTWEEIKDMASQNEYLKEATNTLFELSADERVRKRCRDREDYYADMRGAQYLLDEQRVKIDEQWAEIAQQQAEITQQQAEIAQQQAEITQQQAEIAQQQAEITQQQAEIAQQQAEITQQQAEITQQQAEIERLRKEIAELKANQTK